MVTRAALENVRGYIEKGLAEGAELAVDGRGFKLFGYARATRTASTWAARCSITSPPR